MLKKVNALQFLGQSWDNFYDYFDWLSRPLGIKNPYVSKLKLCDLLYYGHLSSNWSQSFNLLICEHCLKVLLPQAFANHLSKRHAILAAASIQQANFPKSLLNTNVKSQQTTRGLPSNLLATTAPNAPISCSQVTSNKKLIAPSPCYAVTNPPAKLRSAVPLISGRASYCIKPSVSSKSHPHFRTESSSYHPRLQAASTKPKCFNSSHLKQRALHRAGIYLCNKNGNADGVVNENFSSGYDTRKKGCYLYSSFPYFDGNSAQSHLYSNNNRFSGIYYDDEDTVDDNFDKDPDYTFEGKRLSAGHVNKFLRPTKTAGSKSGSTRGRKRKNFGAESIVNRDITPTPTTQVSTSFSPLLTREQNKYDLSSSTITKNNATSDLKKMKPKLRLVFKYDKSNKSYGVSPNFKPAKILPKKDTLIKNECVNNTEEVDVDELDSTLPYQSLPAESEMVKKLNLARLELEEKILRLEYELAAEDVDISTDDEKLSSFGTSYSHLDHLYHDKLDEIDGLPGNKSLSGEPSIPFQTSRIPSIPYGIKSTFQPSSIDNDVAATVKNEVLSISANDSFILPKSHELPYNLICSLPTNIINNLPECIDHIENTSKGYIERKKKHHRHKKRKRKHRSRDKRMSSLPFSAYSNNALLALNTRNFIETCSVNPGLITPSTIGAYYCPVTIPPTPHTLSHFPLLTFPPSSTTETLLRSVLSLDTQSDGSGNNKAREAFPFTIYGHEVTHNPYFISDSSQMNGLPTSSTGFYLSKTTDLNEPAPGYTSTFNHPQVAQFVPSSLTTPPFSNLNVPYNTQVNQSHALNVLDHLQLEPASPSSIMSALNSFLSVNKCYLSSSSIGPQTLSDDIDDVLSSNDKDHYLKDGFRSGLFPNSSIESHPRDSVEMDDSERTNVVQTILNSINVIENGTIFCSEVQHGHDSTSFTQPTVGTFRNTPKQPESLLFDHQPVLNGSFRSPSPNSSRFMGKRSHGRFNDWSVTLSHLDSNTSPNALLARAIDILDQSYSSFHHTSLDLNIKTTVPHLSSTVLSNYVLDYPNRENVLNNCHYATSNQKTPVINHSVTNVSREQINDSTFFRDPSLKVTSLNPAKLPSKPTFLDDTCGDTKMFGNASTFAKSPSLNHAVISPLKLYGKHRKVPVLAEDELSRTLQNYQERLQDIIAQSSSIKKQNIYCDNDDVNNHSINKSIDDNIEAKNCIPVTKNGYIRNTL